MKKHMDPKTGQTGRCEAKSPDTCPVVKDLSAEEKQFFILTQAKKQRFTRAF